MIGARHTLTNDESSIGVVIRGVLFFFFQAEDGIRDLVRSRGLGDVYKRQALDARLPFALTEGQREVSDTLFAELARPRPMQRLSLIHI